MARKTSKVVRSVISVFAVELLAEISSHLPVHSQASLSRTCTLLHDIVSRILYRHVTVSELDARQFFKTISTTTQNYGNCLRSLRFIATSREVISTFFLLCDALPSMQNLQTFTLDVRDNHSPLLACLLKKYALAPSSGKQSDYYAPFRLHNSDTDTLPNLQSFKLHGGIRLLDFARGRNITYLSVTSPMTEKDFEFFIYSATNGTGCNTIINTLVVTLRRRELRWRLSSAINTLDASFPKLESLTIRTPIANALHLSRMFTVLPLIFSHLRQFLLNDWTCLPPVYYLETKEAMDLQLADLNKAVTLRPRLTKMDFGVIRWTRDLTKGIWDRREALPSECLGVEDEDVPANFLYFPQVWQVTYKV